MAAKKAKKFRSKFFRVAVEGATCDGRTIERQDIVDMGETYDPKVYGARIWIDHIRATHPDSAFGAYGDVLAVKTQEVEINGSSKLALFAQIEPTDSLVNLVNVRKQKVFTSIEIAPKFADTGRAYLFGLAVTDTPASLGTEMLAFAAQYPDKNPLTDRKQAPGNLFTVADETAIEFEEVEAPAPRASKLGSLLSALGIKPQPEPEPEPEVKDAAALAAFCAGLVETVDSQNDEIVSLRREQELANQRQQQFATQLASITTSLANTPQNFTKRPVVTGAVGDDATDC